MDSISIIPNFIRARDPKRLRALCLKQNIVGNKSYHYQISYADGEWFAWFFEDAKEEVLQERMNQVKKVRQ